MRGAGGGWGHVAACDLAFPITTTSLSRYDAMDSGFGEAEFGVWADGGKFASNSGHWHRRRSGRVSFQRPCSIPFVPIPQPAATDLLIAGAAEPPAVGVHPG